MPHDEQVESSKISAWGWVCRIVRATIGVGILIVALAVGSLAAAPYFPHFGKLGAGTMVVPQYIGPWIVVACALVVASVVLILIRARITGALTFLVAVVSVVGFAVVLDQQVKFARDEGAEIDVSRAFDTEGLGDRGRADETIEYAAGLNMDVYRPHADTPAPVVVFAHDGEGGADARRRVRICAGSPTTDS